jgi:carbamoyltransferase
MNILGINWGEHDSAACLLQDGRLVAAAEEERFNRIKHAPFAFPLRAAQYCLQAGSLTPQDIDIVASSFSLSAGFGRGFLYALRHFPHANLIASAELVRRAWFIALPGYTRYMLKVPTRTRFISVPHHLAHAASAYFVTPFDDAAILVVDAVGEWAATSLYHGQGKRLEKLAMVDFPHSLGFYYAAFTEYLGFEPFDGEYKVMGMASYGEPRFNPQMQEILRLPEGSPAHRLDLRFFNYPDHYGSSTWYSPALVEAFGPPAPHIPMPPQIYLDIAASVQQRLEQAIFHLAEYLRQHTHSRRLCLAGGVALNSVANGKLIQKGTFDQIFIQPAASDAGSALGAALVAHHRQSGSQRGQTLQHVYLGPQYPASEIEATLRSNRIPYETLSNPAETTADLLSQGQIVGWFQGRMEFGPRALGNRSILADPRRPEMKDRINAAVKFREPFRPFAPSVPVEYSDTYFENVGESPYMILVTQVKPGMAKSIPAVTHVDNTARLHTVSREVNPLYWELLQSFGKKTGVPVLLNTSFNVRGEPIVCTPKEAIACFYNSGLDALVIEGFLLRKSQIEHPAPQP